MKADRILMTVRDLVLTGLTLLLCLVLPVSALADTRVVNLTVGYKTVSLAGGQHQALAINDQIPAPVLHFHQGDHVIINVCNTLNEETALHWHGLLVPWQMDGVLGISQHGIPPHGTFQYRFDLKQSGTYWYHAHAGLQEQRGLYGALVIDPPEPSLHYDRDFVILLSDWSNTLPDRIQANLKKNGGYYSSRFPLQASLQDFLHNYTRAVPQKRKAILSDWLMMQQMRMGLYDISDVAYDAFLLNGQPAAHPWKATVRAGETVRLRFIDAGAGTLFRVKMPGHIMQVVQVQGNAVKPFSLKDFVIAPGETQDVLVKITDDQPVLIYAESADTLGAALGALVTEAGQRSVLPVVTPFPPPAPVAMMGEMSDMTSMSDSMAGMSEMSSHTSHHMHMSHAPMHNMQGMHPEKVATKYDTLSALQATDVPERPVSRVIRMELSGDMEHYNWLINGVPGHDAKPIVFEPGKRYRLVFVNRSMMHHPMHLHGHWLILRNGHGRYDPRLHTIDVPPQASITVDVDADASGQWFFHCHLLYHMHSGMSRIFQYSTEIELVQKNPGAQNADLVRHPSAHPPQIWYSTVVEPGYNPWQQTGKLTVHGLYGPDLNKLEIFVNDAEIEQGVLQNADADIFFRHVMDSFWTVGAGVNYFYRPAVTPYWQPGLGVEGVLPWFVGIDARAYYHAGSAKLDVELSRDTQLTHHFFVRPGIRLIAASKTVPDAFIGSGLNQWRFVVRPFYRVAPGLDIFAEFEHGQAVGRYLSLLRTSGDRGTDNTLVLGVALQV